MLPFRPGWSTVPDGHHTVAEGDVPSAATVREEPSACWSAPSCCRYWMPVPENEPVLAPQTALSNVDVENVRPIVSIPLADIVLRLHGGDREAVRAWVAGRRTHRPKRPKLRPP